MKKYNPYKLKLQTPTFDKVPGINEELVAKGIYLKTKIVSQVVSATGDYRIKCGFPPKLVQVNVQDSDRFCHGETDFTTTFSYRGLWGGASFATSGSSNLISLGTLTGDIDERYTDGFNLNIASYSGSSKTIYLTCFS